MLSTALLELTRCGLRPALTVVAVAVVLWLLRELLIGFFGDSDPR